MASQVKFNLPSNGFCVIDNSAAGVTVTANGTPVNSNNWAGQAGFDITVPGATSQGLNPFGDTGTVLLDSVNDVVIPIPKISTVVGNPVSNTQPTFATVATVINSALTGIRILYKNPA